MKTVFITIAEDIIARNIIYTSFLPEFVRTWQGKIVVLVQHDRVEHFTRVLGTSHQHIIVEGFKRSPPGRFEQLIMSLARSGIDTKTNLWSKMRSYYRGDSSYIATTFKRFHSHILGNVNWYKRLLRKLILTIKADAQLTKLFETYNPEALIALSLTNYDFDVIIAREAKRRKVKIIGMVRSWDNLSSHGLLRVVPDVFLLQNVFLKDMAIEHQAIDPSVTPIKIVGLPHYDSLKHVANIIESREIFLQRMGIEQNKKIIFYGAMGEFLFKHEAEMPEVFNNLVATRAIPHDSVILYRAHPKFMINTSKVGNYPFVVFDTAGKYINTKAVSTGNENNHLVNALYHSDVVVTTASTIAIDAAIMDKPVICTGFDGTTPENKVRYWESARRFYDHYTHFEALMDTGGARIAQDAQQLAREINDYLKNPQRDHEGRQKIIDYFVAPFDGKAGERLAHEVVAEVNKK